MLFFEHRAMDSMETLVHPHAPRNGARRGSDTHSLFLVKIVRAPGTAARLFADVSLQNWTSLARVSARPVIWIP